jgi:hypothetical protein
MRRELLTLLLVTKMERETTPSEDVPTTYLLIYLNSDLAIVVTLMIARF